MIYLCVLCDSETLWTRPLFLVSETRGWEWELAAQTGRWSKHMLSCCCAAVAFLCVSEPEQINNTRWRKPRRPDVDSHFRCTGSCYCSLSPHCRMKRRSSPTADTSSSSPERYLRVGEESFSTSPCLPHWWVTAKLSSYFYLNSTMEYFEPLNPIRATTFNFINYINDFILVINTTLLSFHILSRNIRTCLEKIQILGILRENSRKITT